MKLISEFASAVEINRPRSLSGGQRTAAAFDCLPPTAYCLLFHQISLQTLLDAMPLDTLYCSFVKHFPE